MCGSVVPTSECGTVHYLHVSIDWVSGDEGLYYELNQAGLATRQTCVSSTAGNEEAWLATAPL